MSDRILMPIIAIGLAALVWVYMHSRDQDVIDKFEVPVELQVAAAQADLYDLEVNGPSEARVSFAGSFSRMREFRAMLHRGEVRIRRTVSVPDERLADARYVDVVRLDGSEVPAPPGVRAMIAENQNRIPITMRRLVEKRLPVRLSHTAGDRVEQVVLEPSTVLVRGPKEVLERQDFIATELYTVPGKPGATEPVVLDTPDHVPLVQELEGRTVRVSPGSVSVRFTLKPKQKAHELVDVPVHFLCPANFPYRPQFTSERAGRITLKVQGPASGERPVVAAYVDLTSRKFEPGLHAEEPIRIQLPPGFQLAQEPPRLPSFQLLRVEAATKPTE